MLRLLTLARDVTSITFTPDGATLLAVFNDDTWDDAVGVAWIDPRTGLSDHVAGVMHAAAVAVIPDGSGFVYAVRPEAVAWGGALFRVYDAATGEHRQILWNTEHSGTVATVARRARVFAFDRPSRTGDLPAVVRVWDDPEQGLRAVHVESVKVTQPLWATRGVSVTVFDLSPEGHDLAVFAAPEGRTEVWDVHGDNLRTTLPVRPKHLLWPLDDRLVVLGARELSVWDVASPDPVLAPVDTRVPPLCAGVSPDGRLVAAGGADGVVRVWAMGNAEPTTTYTWDVGAIRGVAFAPDGLTCAAAGERGRVVLWDVEG